MDVTLRQFRYLVAAAAAGQVSQAAVELNVSQSAVTAAIQALERNLGVALFVRSRSGVSLTLEGARFLAQAKSVLASVDVAVRNPLREGGEQTIGRVRVGLTYTVAGYYMPAIHARFRRAHPGIAVELIEAPRPAVEAQLASGALDLAVMLVSNLADHAALAHEVLLRSRRQVWLPADHALLVHDALTLAQVAQEEFVMLTVDEASATAGRYWAAVGLRPNLRFETSSVEAVRSMVASGFGITLLSDMVYRPWSLEGSRIELRRTVEPIPTMDVGIAWHRGGNLSDAAEVFRGFLRAYN